MIPWNRGNSKCLLKGNRKKVQGYSTHQLQMNVHNFFKNRFETTDCDVFFFFGGGGGGRNVDGKAATAPSNSQLPLAIFAVQTTCNREKGKVKIPRCSIFSFITPELIS